jgi:hypothetical protein
MRIQVEALRRTLCMKRTRKTVGPVPADAIARLAGQGKDISRFFRGKAACSGRSSAST